MLVGYRISDLDWTFTNITAGATHLLFSPSDPSANLTYPLTPQSLELRVTNWAYGVQIAAVHVAAGESLVAVPDAARRVEFIGDSLTSGMYTTYEGLSSFGYGIGAGLGETEYSVSAYPGICLVDQDCWGNPRGQVRQWFYTSDTSYRAQVKYGGESTTNLVLSVDGCWADGDIANAENAVPWDFAAHPAADLVVINIGTNDNSYNISDATYQENLTKLIEGIHGVWPNAQVLIMVNRVTLPLAQAIAKLTCHSPSGLAFTSTATASSTTPPSASQPPYALSPSISTATHTCQTPWCSMG